MPSTVSFRYARALVDTMTAPGAGKTGSDPQAIASQLTQFDTLLAGNSELQIVFSTPAVTTGKKKAILTEVAQGMGLDPLTRNFLNVLIDHDRMGLLGEVTEAFQTVLNERLGVAVADVTTAAPLDDIEKQELANALSAKTGKQIQMNFSLDPGLIGGVIARIGSTIYDGSVRGSLERLKTELVGE
jgi:F-type H+-transporting ATPase subunit delta